MRAVDVASDVFGKYEVAATSTAIRAALLDGCGLATFECRDGEEEFRVIAAEVGEVYPHRDADESGVTRVRAIQSDDPGLRGLTSESLSLHTDSSGAHRPPIGLMLWCSEVSGTGGLSLVLNVKELYAELGEVRPDLLHELESPLAAIFKSGRDSYEGPVVTTDEGGLKIRLRLDPLGYFSAPLAKRLGELENYFQRAVQGFQLRANQGYALRNDTWLHGRTAFSGRRELLRVLFATLAQPQRQP